MRVMKIILARSTNTPVAKKILARHCFLGLAVPFMHLLWLGAMA